MKDFLKQLAASFLGVVIGTSLVVLVVFMIILGSIASAGEDKPVSIKENSFLVMDLEGVLSDRGIGDPVAKLMGDNLDYNSLNAWTNAIRRAKDDDRIKGLYIKAGIIAGGHASFKALREALEEFKASGKWIISYGKVYTEKGLYLTSLADEQFIYPTGGVEWNGMATNGIFLRGMFDRFGIDPIVFRVGKYKSAAETFTEKEYSEANRQQLAMLLNDLYDQMAMELGKSRDIPTAALDSFATNLTIVQPEDAIEAGMITGLKYQDEIRQMLQSKMELDEEEELKKFGVSLDKYLKASEKEGSENKIAVMYATGGIISGKGRQGQTVGDESFVKTLRKLKEDKAVKAIVIRVNSPGGSALASDVMAREIELAAQEKPVISSMGDVAASGGYYISAKCSRIFAQPNTITGSIGVIGLFLNTKDLLNDELSLTFDQVYSHNHTHADIGNPNRELTELERKRIQEGVDSIYQDFLRVVKQGRGFPSTDSVHTIAQGRVWSGKRAMDINLVDELGSLDDALTYAAEESGVSEDYEVAIYPKKKSPFERILEDFGQGGAMQAQVEKAIAGSLTPALRRAYEELNAYQDPRGIYMRMPLPTEIN